MKTPFEIVHPAFTALFFVAVLGFSMAVFHPVTLAVFALSGIAYDVVWRGAAKALRPLAWQLPLAAVIALLNPVFSMAGSTELFRMFDHAFYAESLMYGMCMGLMLLAMFRWFGIASWVFTSDKVMLLFGRVAPTLGLLLTMTMRLVPQFVRRGQVISQTRAACTSAGQSKGKMASYVRQTTVLMGWGMEDSLETSDAMRSRGWSSQARRSSYERVSFRAYDALACAGLAALMALCVVCVAGPLSAFAFYPVMGPWPAVWAYAPFLALVLVPVLLEVASR